MALRNKLKSGFVQTHNTKRDQFIVSFCSARAVNAKWNTWKGHYVRGI